MVALLLLGEHVLDQVTHTVAVAKLVVVPMGGENREVRCTSVLLWIYRSLTTRPQWSTFGKGNIVSDQN